MEKGVEGTENWVGVVWEGEEEVEAVLCWWGFVEEAGGHQEVEAVLHMDNQKSAPSIQSCQCADRENRQKCYTVLHFTVH